MVRCPQPCCLPYFTHEGRTQLIFLNREKAWLLSPDDIPLRRKYFAATAESFSEKIEEMLLGCEEAAVTGELKETALSSLVLASLGKTEEHFVDRQHVWKSQSPKNRPKREIALNQESCDLPTIQAEMR